MACPYHRQVDQKANISGLNGYCDAEEMWRLRVRLLKKHGIATPRTTSRVQS